MVLCQYSLSTQNCYQLLHRMPLCWAHSYCHKFPLVLMFENCSAGHGDTLIPVLKGRSLSWRPARFTEFQASEGYIERPRIIQINKKKTVRNVGGIYLLQGQRHRPCPLPGEQRPNNPCGGRDTGHCSAVPRLYSSLQASHSSSPTVSALPGASFSSPKRCTPSSSTRPAF